MFFEWFYENVKKDTCGILKVKEFHFSGITVLNMYLWRILRVSMYKRSLYYQYLCRCYEAITAFLDFGLLSFKYMAYLLLGLKYKSIFRVLNALEEVKILMECDLTI